MRFLIECIGRRNLDLQHVNEAMIALRSDCIRFSNQVFCRTIFEKSPRFWIKILWAMRQVEKFEGLKKEIANCENSDSDRIGQLDEMTQTYSHTLTQLCCIRCAALASYFESVETGYLTVWHLLRLTHVVWVVVSHEDFFFCFHHSFYRKKAKVEIKTFAFKWEFFQYIFLKK